MASLQGFLVLRLGPGVWGCWGVMFEVSGSQLGSLFQGCIDCRLCFVLGLRS